MDLTGLILLAMLPAMALTMLNLGIGPFGHPRFIRHHVSYRKRPAIMRHIIQLVCGLILVAGALQLLGLADLTPSSHNQ